MSCLRDTVVNCSSSVTAVEIEGGQRHQFNGWCDSLYETVFFFTVRLSCLVHAALFRYSRPVFISTSQRTDVKQAVKRGPEIRWGKDADVNVEAFYTR